MSGNLWTPSSVKLISNSSTIFDKSKSEYKWGNILPSEAVPKLNDLGLMSQL